MRRLAETLSLVAVTLWVGGLWVVGYLVVPTLFAMIADRSLAGAVAGRLFALLGWLGVGCAAWLLLYMSLRQGWLAFRNAAFWLVVLMLGIALAILFCIQPLMAELKAMAWPQEVMESAWRERFATWHGVSSVLYLLQSVLGLALVAVSRRALFR